MADPYWWLDKRPLARQGERMGEEPYDPFGVRRRWSNDKERDPDDKRDDRDRRDPRNVQTPPVIPQQAQAAEAAPAAPQPQRSLLDMLSGALGNPANPGTSAEGARSGYGPIPGWRSPTTAQSLGIANYGLGIMQGEDPRDLRRMMRGPMGIGVNPYYGSYR